MPESGRGGSEIADLWRAFVEVLSTNPELIQALMADHLPDEAARCRGCTVSGRGSPDRPWPCSLWLTADAARQARVRRGTSGKA